jgi:hypothetical protein
MIVDLLASPAVAGFSVSKIRGQGPRRMMVYTHRRLSIFERVIVDLEKE